MERLIRELRHAFRYLLRHRSFFATAIATLALAAGATGAVFSLAYDFLIRPLPFEDSGSIVILRSTARQSREEGHMSPGNFSDWKRWATSFEEIAAVNPWSFNIIGEGAPEAVEAARVTRGFFELLRVQPALGRTFSAEEFAAPDSRVVLLTHGFWQRKFGGDPRIVGRQIRLSRELHTVVGILPRDFRLQFFEREQQIWSPQFLNETWTNQRRDAYWPVLGRLKPGITVEGADSEAKALGNRLAQEYPLENSGLVVRVSGLRDHLVRNVRQLLLVLLAVLGFVLLIACSNVGALLVAQGTDRTREFALRQAIGAGRGRLFLQLFSESLALAAAGCAAGMAFSIWGRQALLAMLPASMLPPIDTHYFISPGTLAFSAAITGVITLICGLAPALQFSKPDLIAAMKESGGASPSPKRQRLRNAFVVLQVGLALLLLVSALLCVRSLDRLLKVDPGFAPGNLAALQVFVYDHAPAPGQQIVYFRNTLERLRSVPGIEKASIVSSVPFFAGSNIGIRTNFAIAGRAADPGENMMAYSTIASPDYFETMRIPIRSGRGILEADNAQSSRIAVINETLARRFFQDRNPIGQKLLVGARGLAELEIVGVAGDVLHDGLEAQPRAEFFRPFAQAPFGGMTFMVRTATGAENSLNAIKSAIWEVNAEQPFYKIEWIEDLVFRAAAESRFVAFILGVFAMFAVLMSGAGIYGAMSYWIAQHQREIAMRHVLGAEPSQILWLVFRRGAGLVFAGSVLGLAAASFFGKSLERFLFNVGPSDAASYVLGISALVIIAAVTIYIPARRATRTDPARVLGAQ